MPTATIEQTTTSRDTRQKARTKMSTTMTELELETTEKPKTKRGRAKTVEMPEPKKPIEQPEAVEATAPAENVEEAEPEKTDDSKSPSTKLIDFEIPARMLHVNGCRSRDAGRYATDHVLIETDDETNLISAVATDGRRVIVAKWLSGIFDDGGRILVPGHIAADAARLAVRRAKDAELMAVIHRGKRGACRLTVFSTDGEINFSWQETDGAFPDYAAVLPVWETSPTQGNLGLVPKQVAATLLTIRRIGKISDVEPNVRLHLPTEEGKPVGFELVAADDEIQVIAVVLPVPVSDWVEKEESNETKSQTDPNQMTFAAITGDTPAPGKAVSGDPKSAVDPDAWKSLKTEELGLRQSVFDRVVGGGLATLGDIASWQVTRYETPKVAGIGKAAQQQIDDAFMAFWTRWAERQKAEVVKPSDTAEPKTETVAKDSSASKPANPDAVISINDTKWTLREVDAAYDMELQSRLQSGAAVTITNPLRNVVGAWVCVPVPVGTPADYMLLPLVNRTETVEPDESPYTGAMVMLDGINVLIGRQSDRILIKA